MECRNFFNKKLIEQITFNTKFNELSFIRIQAVREQCCHSIWKNLFYLCNVQEKCISSIYYLGILLVDTVLEESFEHL